MITDLSSTLTPFASSQPPSAAAHPGVDALAPVAGLHVTLADGLLSATIDRPESLNSLTTAVLAGIADAMERAAIDPRVKVVRLGGTGRGFSSGAGMSAEDVANGSHVSRTGNPAWRRLRITINQDRAETRCRLDRFDAS
jgi:hypothetical protein